VSRDGQILTVKSEPRWLDSDCQKLTSQIERGKQEEDKGGEKGVRGNSGGETTFYLPILSFRICGGRKKKKKRRKETAERKGGSPFPLPSDSKHAPNRAGKWELVLEAEQIDFYKRMNKQWRDQWGKQREAFLTDL
jgi:hypothetical protein